MTTTAILPLLKIIMAVQVVLALPNTSTVSSNYLGNTSTGADTADDISNYSFNNMVTIVYNNNTVTVTNNVSGVDIQTSGADVTVNATANDVNYIVLGTTTNGSLVISSDAAFKLTICS